MLISTTYRSLGENEKWIYFPLDVTNVGFLRITYGNSFVIPI